MHILKYIDEHWLKLRSRVVEGNHMLPMSDGAESTHCLNCGTDFVGKYCPNCGQKATVARLSMRQGFVDLITIFTNFESGFFHTCLELIYRPGYMMRDFINGHRKEYVKPIQLLFLLGTLLLLLRYLLYGHGFGEINAVSEEAVQELGHARFWNLFSQMIEWLYANRAAFCLLIVTMLVIPNWLCFHRVDRASRLNISEHFYVMVYVGCQLLMSQIVTMPFERLSGNEYNVGLSVPLLVLVYDFHQLYRISLRRTLFSCILSSVIGLFLFIILLIFAVIAVIVFLGETQVIEKIVN